MRTGAELPVQQVTKRPFVDYMHSLLPVNPREAFENSCLNWLTICKLTFDWQGVLERTLTGVENVLKEYEVQEDVE
jgi:hypothetical protein